MIKTFFLILMLFFSAQSFSQETQWYEYKFDSLISVRMPSEKVYVLDSILNGIDTRQIYTSVGNSTYMLQRLSLKNNSTDENLSNLPHDKESLMTYYKGYSKGISNSRNSMRIEEIEIQKDSFVGMKLKVISSNNKQSSETDVFILNNSVYCFSYFDDVSFNNETKDYFFNSAQINKDNKISQFNGKSQGYRLGYIIGRYSPYLFILVGFVFLIIKLSRKK
ncbi:hypothetical protein [Psychroserpens luteolus]|uniref:hypothetical protein n=1 Tax=Psychroserpens luteolus TaxID=2855840 RepID=UPI001E546062|nr:hypothetical protein [Psychroserpens luteolus]MCD2258733.1 hypothetical protein [Psychroserpens luteolus]